ncbi:hypothetical protein QBC46DRAFT_279003 [Diplogelasinospora grovesii]|uniref:Meiotically up-regulated gene 154 protein n=1 Tax=Diplogelasinospora grovesii TaxID=303347 RepID=A0AAN6S8Z7_9PEZI|nr:hypothetical protein QBC46DRAFT_279003 [Diplogelasinospora grovesii]
MPPTPRRLVRRAPLSERLTAMLNPLDFYLWLSEEIQTFNWDSTSFGTRFGLVANFIFLLARANVGGSQTADDVFSDAPARGWITYLVQFLVWTLIPISCLNAYYTMTRTRQYRLFETNVERPGPSTPSAHRVRVDSSPVSSSPLRLIQDVMGSSAEARAHPDKTRDVWEISVWDPYQATLRIFCLFSPGHILIDMLFLPLLPLDPRPSVTVFKCLVLQILLSTQLYLLVSRFTQQSKDLAIIQREVMHEYDTKFVHPRLQPVMRSVGTQISVSEDGGLDQESVEIGPPATLLRRGFQTHPNANYAKFYDPDGISQQQTKAVSAPSLFTTPQTKAIKQEPLSSAIINRSSGLRQSLPPPSARAMSGAASSSSLFTNPVQSSYQPTTNFGGNLGVYTHANSPLKKATSMGDMNGSFSPRNSREMAALEQRELADRMVRQSSPLKENRRATTQFDAANYVQSPNTLAHLANARANRWTQERFPSRRV